MKWWNLYIFFCSVHTEVHAPLNLHNFTTLNCSISHFEWRHISKYGKRKTLKLSLTDIDHLGLPNFQSPDPLKKICIFLLSKIKCFWPAKSSYITPGFQTWSDIKKSHLCRNFPKISSTNIAIINIWSGLQFCLWMFSSCSKQSSMIVFEWWSTQRQYKHFTLGVIDSYHTLTPT